MTTDRPSAVQGIDHIGILVHDLDAALPFYRDVLGLSVIAEDVNLEAHVRLVYLDAGGSVLQLVSPFGPGGIADALARQGEGLHHICFVVEDIPTAIPQIAPGDDPPITLGGRNRRTCFLTSRPSGLVIELTEREEAGAPVASAAADAEMIKEPEPTT